jgi:hypothetical protein
MRVLLRVVRPVNGRGRGSAVGHSEIPPSTGNTTPAVRGLLSLSTDLVRWYGLDGSDSPDQLGDFYSDLALKMVATADRRET